MSSLQEWGKYFIPPYEYNENMIDGRNPNLHLSSIQVTYSGGIGDHGFTNQAGYSNTGLTPVPTPLHTESSSVMFHHEINYIAPEDITTPDGTTISKGSTLDPYTVYGYGTYTSALEYRVGIPTKSAQGVQALWEVFYENYYQISELEWNTEKPYYHYLWSKYLAEFVLEFLPNFFKLNEAPSNNPQTLDAMVQENKDSIYYYTNLIQGDEASVTQAQLNYSDSLSSTLPNLNTLFFEGDTYTLSDGTTINNAITDITSAYTQAFAETPGSSNIGTNYKTLQEWFLGYNKTNYSEYVDALNLWWQFDLENTTNNGQNLSQGSLIRTFELFMISSDIIERDKASFIWSFNEIISMLAVLQASGEYQSDRLIIYNEAERSSVSAMQYNVSFTIPKSSTDKSSIKHDQCAQNSIQVYKSYQDINGKYLSQQDSAVSGTQNNIKSQASLMQTIMQTMDGLLQGIFNR